MYSIKEVSQLSGVSVRTLHYYDTIGLLSPQKSENQYRLYSENDLDKLQQILFYKVLEFSLKDIKKMMQDSKSRHLDILLQQQQLLKQRYQHLEQVIVTIDKTIEAYKGERIMTEKEKLEVFSKDYFGMYEEEASQKYGEDAVKNAKNIYDNPEMRKNWVMVFSTLAECHQKGISVEDSVPQEQVALLYQNMNHVFECSLEVFKSIGQGYVFDSRFKQNIDQFGEGTAEYISRAIAYYVERNA